MVIVKGQKAIINRWARANKRIGRRAARGLRAGSKFLLEKSQELVPTESGDLKKSGYFKNIGKRSGMGAVYAIGYTATYAMWVHEDTTAAHGRMFNLKHAAEIAKATSSDSIAVKQRFSARRPEERSKFLSFPARRYRRNLRKIITREAKI